MGSRSSLVSILRQRRASEVIACPLPIPMAVILLAVSLSSCDASPLFPDERRNLTEAEALWASHELSSYSFEMRRSCFCAPVVLEWARIEVVDGEVHRVMRIESGTEVSAAELEYFPTVGEIFASIHSILNGDWMERINLAFDAEYGFPSEVHFRAKAGIADADGSYFLRNLEPSSGN